MEIIIRRIAMFVRNYLASLFVAGALTVGAVATADAQQTRQDGLINVNVGDVTILEDVNVGVAAQVAANICGVKVGPLAILGTAVDRSGTSRTVCETDQGPVTLTQN
jgi:hypothetical protein